MDGSIFQVRIYLISRGCCKCPYCSRLKTTPVDRPEGLNGVAVYDCIVSRIGGGGGDGGTHRSELTMSKNC